MRAPLSWIREYVDLPPDVTATDLAHRLTALGLKLEALESPGADVEGPLVVGRVRSAVDEPQKNGKTIKWCQVDCGPEHGEHGIVCGAHNFGEGDLVVVSLPGTVLPGGFAITARKTYGHVSDGMICSAKELGIGDDHDGILVLDPRVDTPADAASPAEVTPGDPVVDLLGLRDEVIEFEINPDRAYALSLRGIARDAALAYDAPFRDPAVRDVPAPNDDGYPVRVDAPDGCPVFATRAVTGFDPSAPTPRWLARRVQLAGMRPISLAVDVTNYVMLELGQPLHGYDGDRLAGPVVVRRASEGERLTTLDDVTRTLSSQDLLITDDSGPIGLAGVMGGRTTELSGSTSHVVIEAAHFEPTTIFRTARRHKLPSEASKRFERGVDPLLPAYAADRVAQLLVEHGGGTVSGGVTYVGRPPVPPVITAGLDLAARVTGMPIDGETAVHHLRAVGCTVTTEGAMLTALPPSWRPDLSDPYDLVEEVARVVGYTEVPSVLPTAPVGRGLTKSQKLRRRVGFALAGAGLVEVRSWPFVGGGDLDRLGLPAEDLRRRTLRVANPLSDQRPELTTTLLPGLLETAARNVSRGTTALGLYEAAPVFLPTPDRLKAPILGVDWRPDDAELDKLNAAVPQQPLTLAAVLAGDRQPSGWWGRGRPAELGRRSRGRPRGRPGAAGRRGGGAGPPGAVAPRSLRTVRRRRGGGRTRRRAAPGRVHGLWRAGAHQCPRGRPRPADPGRAERRARAHLLDVPGGQGGRRARRRGRPARSHRGGDAAGGRRRPAGVGAAVRRLHRRPDRRGPQVAGVRPAVPRARPHAHRARDRRRARRGGRAGRAAARGSPALRGGSCPRSFGMSSCV